MTNLLSSLPFWGRLGGGLFLLFFLAASVAAQEYKFLFSSSPGEGIRINESTRYGNGNPWGYDLGTGPGDRTPWFFSIDLPEGTYQVTVKLGSNTEESCTTVKSESRRIMLRNIKTAPGDSPVYTFAVNIRNTKIGETDSVRINPRERGKLIWDDKLTLEFNGKNPSVRELSIQPACGLPVIFLAGNSTVVDEGQEPWCGWGQVFPSFFTEKIAIANYAESGQAANTFVSSKRLAKMLTKVKPGDFLLIEFGHNDQKQTGEGKGPYSSYKSDLKHILREALAKGVQPILVTPMHRRRFDEHGKVVNTHGEYPNAMKQLAEEEQIPLIDLNSMSQILYEAWGVEGSKQGFVHYPAGTFPGQDQPLEDNTHFNVYGAFQIAQCILRGLIELNSPVIQYLRDGFTGYDPAAPDDPATFYIPPTPLYTSEKPLGN
ncbi:MAG: rhamnogalacturonan acetylesterase [Tannerellaceae bacterium]|nr:rhamnogalacturonan acetylesterase [Tannerellaceae bacterium]